MASDTRLTRGETSGWHWEEVPRPQKLEAGLSLFDHVHQWTYKGDFIGLTGTRHKEWEAACLRLRMMLRRARRFVLDDDFTREAVRRGAVQPAKMLNLCNLANLPFDDVWIEYDNNVRVDMQHAMGTSKDRNRDLGKGGFLLSRIDGDPSKYRAYLFDEQREMPIAALSLVIDTTGMLPYLRPLDNLHRAGQLSGPALQMEHKLRGMGWGYFKEKIIKGSSFDYRCGEELARRGGIAIDPMFFQLVIEESVHRDNRDGNDENCQKLLKGFSVEVMEERGSLRFLVAILAMINNVPVQYVHRPAKGFLRQRLRNVPYLDSHLVIIHADRVRVQTIVDRAIKEALGRHNKRHEVRGHWALAEYGHGGRACRHEPLERDGVYALCGKCSKLIVWRDHYERGDAALGFVRHDYEVKR